MLDLYLGMCFDRMDFTGLRFASLYSLYIISRTPSIRLIRFLERQTSLRSLSVEIPVHHETQNEILSGEIQERPVSPSSLQNLLALSLSLENIHWFKEILARGDNEMNQENMQPTSISQKPGIRCLQMTVGSITDLEQILQATTALKSTLRAIDILISNEDVAVKRILENLNEAYPHLVELKLFAYSRSDTSEYSKEASSTRGTYFQQLVQWILPFIKYFNGNGKFRAFSLITVNKNQSKTSQKLTGMEIDELTSYLSPVMSQEKQDDQINHSAPSHLEYIAWDDHLLRINRESDHIVSIMQTYPYEKPKRTQRSIWNPEWHDTMVLNHTYEDHVVQ